jgi:Thioredoxin like C-terminal domain
MKAGAMEFFRVSIDGRPPGAAHGLDVDEAGNGSVVEQRLYQLIRQPKPIVERTFEIEVVDSGVETLAFTFG